MCAYGKDQQLAWFNTGSILSTKTQRAMSSESTVDMKSNRVGKKNYAERNVRKSTVNQPRVCYNYKLFIAWSTN